jgi:ABC-type antimicrobial peptide transport system permease subunit
MNELPEPMIYESYFQEADDELMVQLRTNGNPVDLVPAVEHAIHEIDSELPVFDVRTMREDTQASWMFAVMQSTFAGMFAVIALVLAVTGIYGVVAYRTQLRTHEIGVRVALGASRADVLKLVLRHGMWLTALGLALGLALSFALTRFIAGLLYGISENDATTVIAVVVLLGMMSFAACFLPALRAMRANPVDAIREQ